jgi:hypothetical protein
MATFLPSTSQNSKYSATNSNLDAIEAAILAFVSANGYLPCPALHNGTVSGGTFGIASGSCATGTAPSGIYGMLGTNFTSQNRIGGGTATKTTNEDIWVGVVPTRTLGLPDSMMYDGFGNRITYAIPRMLGRSASEFSQYSTQFQQIIQISDASNNIVNPPSTSSTTPNPIAYVLLSHGANSSGANTFSGGVTTCPTTGADRNNCGYISSPTFNTFYDTPFNDLSANYFDDVVRWKTLTFLETQAALSTISANNSGSNNVGKLQVARYFESTSKCSNTMSSSPATRAFDTIDPSSNLAGASLNTATNTVTLAPGTYMFRAIVPIDPSTVTTPASAVSFYIVIRDVTNNANRFTSTTIYNYRPNSVRAITLQNVSGVFKVTSTANYQVWQYATQNGATFGNSSSQCAIFEIERLQ